MPAAATASASGSRALPNGKASAGVSGNGHGAAAAGGDAAGIKLGKAARRRAKKKEEKKQAVASGATASAEQSGQDEQNQDDTADEPPEYAPPEAPEVLADPALDEEMRKYFGNVFQHFAQVGSSSGGGGEEGGEDGAAGPSGKGEVIYSDEEALSDSDDSDREDGKKPLSKKKQKKMQRLTVAELKQLVAKPDVVDGVDVTANDPRLLVAMKSYKNTVPVPAHWSLKRDYLGNKRGIEKPPFQLPSYIADTGIATVKDALREKEADQTLKAQTRQRVQPKMGKVDIDYQKLHDAFFRFQSKPDSLTGYGELYYEGKEFETKFKERRPGELSDELKEALSIPPLAPPPYLIGMQRYGPPPSYPHLKIPGLNSPIPPGSQWGFHAGGWGRPPMDELGRPLYGDVLGDGSGLTNGLPDTEAYEQNVQKELWGELEPEEEAEEEEEEEEEEEKEEEQEQDAEEQSGRRQGDMPYDGMQTPSGLDTPSGMQSVSSTIPPGLETPAFIELRKDGRGGPAAPPPPPPTAPPGQPKQLYQVINDSSTSIGGLMGSERGYDVYGAGIGQGNQPVLGAEETGRKRKSRFDNGYDVTLDPAELEGMSEAEVAKRYEEAHAAHQRAQARGQGTVNDTSREEMSMLREELARKRHQKEARRQEGRETGGGRDNHRF